MKYVVIYTLDENANQMESARCEYKNNIVVCSGEKAIIENLEKSGVYNEKKERLLPKDGMVFLEALSKHFNSGYISSSEILEDNK